MNKKRRLNKLRDITNQVSGKDKEGVVMQESSSHGRMQFTFYNDRGETTHERPGGAGPLE